jgi:competence protein CoiA
MRFASVNDVRLEAAPGLIGCCPNCSQPMIAKCGTQRIWHWAHRSTRNCDSWWEPETIWHRTWKDWFPSEWQEVPLSNQAGQKHVADVRTESGLVIEFQHSPLSPKDRFAREAFHQNMVWVVDGTRLKKDRPRFTGSRRFFRPVLMRGLFITRSPEECFPFAWLDCNVQVFFDFEGVAETNEKPQANRGTLWCLLAGRVEGQAVIAAISRDTFVDAAQKHPQIIRSREIMELIAASLRRERMIAELNARSRSYAQPKRQKWGSRPFRSRGRRRF